MNEDVVEDDELYDRVSWSSFWSNWGNLVTRDSLASPEKISQPTMRLWTPLLQGFTSDQMRLAEENTALIEQREKEIQSIVQSISELNEIFRDLATMIVEQVRQTRLTVFSRNKLSQVSQNTSAFYENWLSNCAYAVLYFVLYIVLLYLYLRYWLSGRARWSNNL